MISAIEILNVADVVVERDLEIDAVVRSLSTRGCMLNKDYMTQEQKELMRLILVDTIKKLGEGKDLNDRKRYVAYIDAVKYDGGKKYFEKK